MAIDWSQINPTTDKTTFEVGAVVKGESDFNVTVVSTEVIVKTATVKVSF